MDILISGIYEGLRKDINVPITTTLTIKDIRQTINTMLNGKNLNIQIKQGNFYYKDDDLITDILQFGNEPFSFEVGNASIPIDICYGTKKLGLLVDSICTIHTLKNRFNQIVNKDKNIMDVVYALYNEIVCNDSSTIEKIGIDSFSTLYVCPEFYELTMILPDQTSLVLLKPYYTSFYTIQQEIADHYAIASTMLSFTLQSSTNHIISLSYSSEQLYKLFDTMKVTINTLQSLTQTIQLIEKQVDEKEEIMLQMEDKELNNNKEMEEAIQTMKLTTEKKHKYNKQKMNSVLLRVNELSSELEAILDRIDELESIRKEQLQLIKEWKQLETSGNIGNEMWKMIKQVDQMEVTIGKTDTMTSLSQQKVNSDHLVQSTVHETEKEDYSSIVNRSIALDHPSSLVKPSGLRTKQSETEIENQNQTEKSSFTLVKPSMYKQPSSSSSSQDISTESSSVIKPSLFKFQSSEASSLIKPSQLKIASTSSSIKKPASSIGLPPSLSNPDNQNETSSLPLSIPLQPLSQPERRSAPSIPSKPLGHHHPSKLSPAPSSIPPLPSSSPPVPPSITSSLSSLTSSAPPIPSSSPPLPSSLTSSAPPLPSSLPSLHSSSSSLTSSTPPLPSSRSSSSSLTSSIPPLPSSLPSSRSSSSSLTSSTPPLPSSSPPLPSSLTSSAPLLPSSSRISSTPSISEEKDNDNDMVIMKPSKMKERIEMMNKLNQLNQNRGKSMVIKPVQAESKEVMPNLYKEFALPRRPRKMKK